MAKKKIVASKPVVSDSESESSSSKQQEHEQNSDSDGSDGFDSDHKVSASSTQIVHLGKPEADSNVKLQLIDIISELPLTKLTYSKALKSIKWNTIEITGYTTDKLKEELNEIIKATVTVRSLGEILTDYRDNRAKYEFKNHPNRPTKPVNAHMLYIKDNKEKLQQKYEKAHPDEKTSYLEFQAYCFGKFNALSEAKQAPYKELYMKNKKEYNNSLKVFYALHPDLDVRAIMKVSNKVERAKKAPKNPVAVTPFHAYRESLTNAESFAVAQKMWKDMHPEEKCKFIKEVANSETHVEKKISKEEWKILEQEGVNGLPKKPSSAYQIFVSDFSKTYQGERKLFMEKVSGVWKALSEEKKAKYNEMHAVEVEKYHKELKMFIKALPKDKQPMMMQKFKKELAGERKRKNSLDQTVLEESKMSMMETSKIKVKEDSDASQPPTNKKKREREVSPVKIKQSQSYDSDGDVPTSPKKKKNGESLQESPKKKKNGESPLKKTVKRKDVNSSDEDSDEIQKKVVSPKKKSKSEAPAYPSQTTAHYFMTKHFKGGKKEIPKAYKSLSHPIKAKYTAEMKRAKQNFLESTADYIQTLSEEEVTSFKQTVKDLKQQQIKEIGWHNDTGTDDETNVKKRKASTSSSDSSDSDSS